VLSSRGVCIPVKENLDNNVLENGSEKYIISVKGEIIPEKMNTQSGFLILDFESKQDWIKWLIGLIIIFVCMLIIFKRYQKKKESPKDSIEDYLETLKRAKTRDDFEYLWENKSKLDNDLLAQYENLWNVLDQKLYKKELNQDELAQIIQIKEQIILVNGRLQ